VRLNRAVAVAMAGDIDAGLAIVDELSGDARLERYYLLEATRADLLRRRGDQAAAAAAYERALSRAPSEVERRYLLSRLQEVGTGSPASAIVITPIEADVSEHLPADP
jgi:RNA polymerase sigma-70 factor (ECF subfamily)